MQEPEYHQMLADIEIDTNKLDENARLCICQWCLSTFLKQ